MNEFHFIRPVWLLALLPYLAILVLMLRHKFGQGNWSAVCDPGLLPYLLQEKPVRLSRWPFVIGALAALLAIVAMAGPSWQRLPMPVFRNDSALVIALDLSRSMDAEDVKPSRLIRARYKIADMLKQRKDGQTALVVYAGDAFTVTPLTDDTETIVSQLEALSTEIMPSPGSNAAAVLNKAVDLFKQAGLQKGRIILITDGVDLDNTLAFVKSLNNYSLSVLGVGTTEGAPIAKPEGGFIKDSKGTIVIPRLNTDELAKLASAGNGTYQTLTTDDADIQALLTDLDSPEHRQQGAGDSQSMLQLWEDKGPWLALLVLPFAALSFRRGLLSIALLLLLPFPETGYALEWHDFWQTRDQQAEQAYKKGQYDRAAKLFENPDWKAAAQYKAEQTEPGEMKSPKSAIGFYNQGNVMAKSGRFEEAIQAYDEALKRAVDPKLIDDAETNKKLVKDALEQQKKQQDRQSQDDKQQQSGDNADPNQDGEKEQNKSAETDESSEPEKSEGQSEQDKDQQESSTDQQQSKPEEKSEAEKAEKAEQRRDHENTQEDHGKQAGVESSPTDEQQQANEQWLNRIPDDPAGLLKRKFKYQYDQRRRQSDTGKQNW